MKTLDELIQKVDAFVINQVQVCKGIDAILAALNELHTLTPEERTQINIEREQRIAAILKRDEERFQILKDEIGRLGNNLAGLALIVGRQKGFKVKRRRRVSK